MPVTDSTAHGISLRVMQISHMLIGMILDPEPTLQQAIDAYLAWAEVHKLEPRSVTAYRGLLNAYARELGPDAPVGETTGAQWYAACNTLWAARMPRTYNLGRTAALSFLGFCRDNEPAWIDWEAPRLWKPRKVAKDRARALPRHRVESLFEPDAHALRERCLWGLLYNSSERLEAILSLDVPDLNWEVPCAKLRIKGGDLRYISWGPGLTPLLREYVDDRTTGPVFLTDVRPHDWATRPPEDRAPDGRRYRLSAARARQLYKAATGRGPHSLRHSRLTHLGEDGASQAMLKQVGGHTSDALLNRYAQPGIDAVARFMAQMEERTDP